MTSRTIKTLEWGLRESQGEGKALARGATLLNTLEEDATLMTVLS